MPRFRIIELRTGDAEFSASTEEQLIVSDERIFSQIIHVALQEISRPTTKRSRCTIRAEHNLVPVLSRESSSTFLNSTRNIADVLRTRSDV